MGDVTRLLRDVARGSKTALNKLLPLLETQLRAEARDFMRRERADHTLQATALVNEVYLRLVQQKQVDCRDRSHFLAVAAKKMREILKNHARDRKAKKRGGDWEKIPFRDGIRVDESRYHDAVALDEALDKLSALDPRLGEIIEMRLFGGLEARGIAEVLEVSTRTIERDLKAAMLILLKELSDVDESQSS